MAASASGKFARPAAANGCVYFSGRFRHALARGEDPYAITFPNVYAPTTTMYGPGLVKDDRVQFGFPYPPLVLLFTAPAQLLLGDFRYAYLLAMLMSGVMIVAIRPDKIGMLVAGIYFSCAHVYLLEIGFTEPLSVMLLLATLLCAMRFAKLMPVMLGLFLASKQYLPAAIFLLPILCTGRDLAHVDYFAFRRGGCHVAACAVEFSGILAFGGGASIRAALSRGCGEFYGVVGNR